MRSAVDTRTELSLEFVREFQVVSNGWAVENGIAAGWQSADRSSSEGRHQCETHRRDRGDH